MSMLISPPAVTCDEVPSVPDQSTMALTLSSSDSTPVHEPTHSAYELLSSQLRKNPHNPEGWRRLMEVAELSADATKISETYQALLKQYPNTAIVQARYLSHLAGINPPNLEEVIDTVCKSSWSVEVWSFYLTWIRRKNAGPEIAQWQRIKKAYKLALSRIGQDQHSGVIWNDYLEFLRIGEGMPTNEKRRTDILFKAYYQAVRIPLENLEQLWRDLNLLEATLNKDAAEKRLSTLSPDHVQALVILGQLLGHVTTLYPPSTQELVLPSLPRYDITERALIKKWKAYLRWEETNPLKLDKKKMILRLQGVYAKALVRVRYYTKLWFMAYSWMKSVGLEGNHISILRDGLDANPASLLLAFAYTEELELREEFGKVHEVYKNFLVALEANIGSLASSANPLHNGDWPSSDHKTTLEKSKVEYGQAWIMYMRFARRAEGVTSSRLVFSEARKMPWTPWSVWEAAAMMEYHCSSDKIVAGRILQKGLIQLAVDVKPVLRCLDFFISINDEEEARRVFEQGIVKLPPNQAQPLWERWARYQYCYGGLDASMKLQKRMGDAMRNLRSHQIQG